MPRRLLSVLVLVAIALAILIGVRWGKPRVVARASSAVVAAPAGEGATIAWIERDGGSSHLRVKRGRGAPAEVLASETVSGLAVRGGRILTSLIEAPSGEAKLRSIGAGGDQKDIAVLSAPAGEIAAGDGWVCWAAGGEPRLPAAPFIAAAGPVVVVGAVPETGGAPVAVTGQLGSAQANLVGLASGKVYWLERQRRGGRLVTRVMRRALQGGAPEVLAEEPGDRSAVLLKGRVAWTAPSQESSSPASFVSVKVMPLSGGEAKVVADWLGSGARLLASGDRLYAQDRECLWRIGEARGTQQVVCDRSYGATRAALVGGSEYLVADQGRGTVLLARGVTWTAKLLHALGLGS
jgi:hypothetical protein